MRIDEIAPKVYDLLILMLASQSTLAAVDVIRRYENGPRPKPIYLAYNPNPNIREVGKATQTEAVGITPVCYRQDYTISVDIHEVGGDGQYLQLIKQAQYNLGVRTYLSNELLVLNRIGPVFSIPKLLDDDNWEKEASMEMFFSFTHVTQDTTTYIETVEVNNNI